MTIYRVWHIYNPKNFILEGGGCILESPCQSVCLSVHIWDCLSVDLNFYAVTSAVFDGFFPCCIEVITGITLKRKHHQIDNIFITSGVKSCNFHNFLMQLMTQEITSVKSKSKHYNFHWSKYIWKCHLQNGSILFRLKCFKCQIPCWCLVNVFKGFCTTKVISVHWWQIAFVPFLSSTQLGNESVPSLNSFFPGQNGRHFADGISNTFSWMKMYWFRIKFHWHLFPMVQLAIFQHWFR